MKPMLASPCAESFERGVLRAVNDEHVGLDVKMDGDRLLVVVGSKIEAYNRNGEKIDVPRTVAKVLRGLGTAMTIVLDGELVDGTYFLFDVHDTGERLVRASDRWQWRRRVLDQLVANWAPDPNVVQVVPWAIDVAGKAEIARTVITTGLEGCIAKGINSPYRPPHKKDERSPDWTKLKFTKDADFVVTRLGVDGKQNMELGLYAPGEPEPVIVGEVSALTGDGPRIVQRLREDPATRVVVTVTFLYVGANGRLVQPVTPKFRTDKNADECTIDQLPPRRKKARRVR